MKIYEYKKKRRKGKLHRHAHMHVSECTHAKYRERARGTVHSERKPGQRKWGHLQYGSIANKKV
jgi:hypothetical protein